MKRFAAAAAVCLLSVGCYTYRPLEGVEASGPTAGAKVEARLTKAGSAALVSQLGADVQSVEGLVVAVDSTAMTLAVEATETARARNQWKGEHVTLPRASIASIGLRKLSVPRTALVGGIAGGGIVAAAAILGGTSSSASSTGGVVGSGVQ
jgi:hypothetical protein